MADRDVGAEEAEERPRESLDARRFDLHSVVVSYEGSPDRCTVYPRRRRCIERTTEWLTADFASFVDLSEVR
jgi:hypothetical protein